MHIQFENPGFDYSMESILQFLGEGKSEQWRGALFIEYPQIDRERYDALPVERQPEYVRDVLRGVYDGEEAALGEKVERYNRHWALHRARIEDAFSDAFAIDCAGAFNGITGNITLNPICPRYLDTSVFDVFYLNSERGALGIALHEVVHFVWFDVWQRHFRDDASEYETPHLKWIFSEMVVDPIMRRDERLSGVNPYFAGGCAYDCFYTMKIDGKPVLETLYAMYEGLSMVEFMERGYAYCVAHEGEIRAQMQGF